MAEDIEFKRAFKFACSNCGKASVLPFQPKADQLYFCADCLTDLSSKPRQVLTPATRKAVKLQVALWREASGLPEEEDGPDDGPPLPEFDAVCSNCGELGPVPYLPRADQPAFCPKCFASFYSKPRDELEPWVQEAIDWQLPFWKQHFGVDSRGEPASNTQEAEQPEQPTTAVERRPDAEGVVLGIDIATAKPVRVRHEDRLRGLYIIGLNGTGKSTLIENLAYQDMCAGLGACVLDPHGDLVDKLLACIPSHRLGDVALLEPLDTTSPFGLNPFSCIDFNDQLEVNRRANQFVELIQKLWGPEGSEGSSWGPNIPMLLRNTAFAFLANPGMTMADIPRFLGDGDYREHVLQKVKNPYCC